MIPRVRLKEGVVGSASIAIFFSDSDSGWQTTLALFSLALTPGSLVACCSTASASARFFRRPQPIVRTQLDRNSASVQSSSGMLRCELVAAVPGSAIQSNLHWDPMLCEGKSLPLCSPSTPLLGLWVPSPRVSPFRLECRMHCHLETTEQLVFQVFCPCPISNRVMIAIPCSVTITASVVLAIFGE